VRSSSFSLAMRLVLNHAMLALAISLGRRTGLFETMARLPPSTDTGIARAANLDPRRVRAWLGAMVTGRIVDYDGAYGTYLLPREHAAVLTDAAGTDDLALAMQSVPALGRTEPDLVRCFRTGADLPDDLLREWSVLREEEIARRQRASLLDEILPMVPGLVPRLQAGIDVLDVGDAGRPTRVLKQAFPGSRFATCPLAALEHTAAFDLVTAFDCLHAQALSPFAALAAVSAALRPRGVLLCMEIAGASDLADNVEHPLGPLLYTVSTFRPGAMWGEEQARRLIASAGFRDVAAHRVGAELAHVYYVATKPP
jgi:hypothetical protein